MLIIMKITYHVAWDDFISVQKPFVLRAGRNAGFIGAVCFCALICALGVLMIVQGFGYVAGLSISCLGALSCVAAWLFERRAVANRKTKYETNLAVGFQQIHCRDHREFETNENGFTTICDCGTVARPWTELSWVTDTKNLLIVGSKRGMELIPKSAFASEGELTEFRSYLLEKLNGSQAPLLRQFEFAYVRSDIRSARWLHIWKAGGVRNLSFALVRAWGFGVVVFFFLTKMLDVSEGTARAVTIGVMGFLSAFFIFRIPGKLALARVRIHYGREGFQVGDHSSRTRYSWNQFIGYLENKGVLLLYVNPGQYKIIPKRALESGTNEFREMVRASVRPYNYRDPFPTASDSLQPTAAENRK
jgi:hypothetical protein